MRNNLKVALLAALLLTGCSNELQVVENSGAKFTIQPEAIRVCNSPAVATLTWEVPASYVNGVKIFAIDPYGKESLFAAGGLRGTEQTGPWVVPDTVFILTDDKRSKLLAKIQVKRESCS